MQLTPKSSERRWKINTMFHQCSPQSIIQSMQEGVRSSYNTKIQLRGRFKATSRRVTQEFLLGPVPFLKNAHVVCVCGGMSLWPIFSWFQGHPQSQLYWKEAFLHLLLKTARIIRLVWNYIGSTCYRFQFENYQTVKSGGKYKFKMELLFLKLREQNLTIKS